MESAVAKVATRVASGLRSAGGELRPVPRLEGLFGVAKFGTSPEPIEKRGVHYILAGAAHQSIAALFSKADTGIARTRRNSIGGNTAVRCNATEYLFTDLNSAG